MRERAEVEFERAAAPLLTALAEAGVSREGLGVFRSRRLATIIGELPVFDAARALPLLLHWLPRIPEERVKEAIVHHLGHLRKARCAILPVLVQEFRNASSDHLRWQIGDALERLADARACADLAEIACDRSYGRSREMVVLALGRARTPDAVPVLVGLLDDDEVAGHALAALRKLAPVEARSDVARFVDHPRAWWRNEAKKAVAKIDAKRARPGQA